MWTTSAGGRFTYIRICVTEGDWFYWYFRVQNAAGRRIRVQFTQGKVVGARGPATSLDEGRTWFWLQTPGRKSRLDSFSLKVPKSAREVRFCFSMPYTEQNLTNFLQTYAGHPTLASSTLCNSRKGRPVEKFLIGNLSGRPRKRVVLSTRHHACEMMANYALEGFLGAILAETPDGAWWREHALVLAIPFVDKDGVEDGDQGNNRRPWDHGRDYGEQVIYLETRALREFLPLWLEESTAVVLDILCPYITDEVMEPAGRAVCGWSRIAIFHRSWRRNE